MNRSIRLFGVATALALVLPAVSAAQDKAGPRSSPPPASAPGGGSSGGGSAAPASGSSSSSSGSSAPASSPAPAPPRTAGARPAGSPPGAGPRPLAAPNAVVVGASGAPVAGARLAGPRPGPGTIGVRPNSSLVAFPFFGPWGGWYPWYGSAFGWNLGFVTYDPWRYGATDWIWGPYGMGYDPYGYAPYAYATTDDEQLERQLAPSLLRGSVRVRATPGSAKVYVDGAYTGTADEFGGFTHHLQIEPGRHEIAIRADGFESYSTDVTVELNRTITVRASLKKTR